VARTSKTSCLRFFATAGENSQTCWPGPFFMALTLLSVTKQLEIAGYRDIQCEQV